LAELGIDHVIVTPEQVDIPLSARVNRINNHYKGNPNCVVLSIHSNGSNTEQANGWEVWTSKGQTKSDSIATEFFKSAKDEFPRYKMRTDTKDGDPDKESQFYILKYTNCPAVLTENLFHTNYNECKNILMSEKGVDRIVDLHVQAIINVEKHKLL
jgi:N-acetylmuramoyl-L-alanine amidase